MALPGCEIYLISVRSRRHGEIELIIVLVWDILRQKGKNMARNAKVLRVTLEALSCTDSSGDGVGGENLEVFGVLGAHGIFLDPNGNPQSGFSRTLWQLDEEHSQDIAQGSDLFINQSVEFPVFQRDFLWIGGQMKEDDILVDEFLGADKYNYEKFPYDNIIHNTFPSVVFNKEHQEIVAKYKIEILRIDEHPELN
jgi:hypothetical protein